MTGLTFPTGVNLTGKTFDMSFLPKTAQIDLSEFEPRRFTAAKLANAAGKGLMNLSRFSPNSYENAQKRFNQDNLAYDINQDMYSSQQDLYGKTYFEDGGEFTQEDVDILNQVYPEDNWSQFAPDPLLKLQADFEAHTLTLEEQIKKQQDLIDELGNSYHPEYHRYKGPRVDNDYQSTNPYHSTSNNPYQSSAGLQKFGKQYEDLDENVVDATQELMMKFPHLKLTSGRRSWGDKDAHPKGRAVDLSYDPKAFEYYRDVIVPKYGFNKALNPHHGTGPHIHLGYYKQGGDKFNF